MLLYASNYSLRLYGIDINADMCKMVMVNAWLYMPWVVAPAHGLIDWNTTKDYEKALRAIRIYRDKTTNPALLLTYKPKTNTLSDWL